jgi:hypothetical protein
MKMMMKMLFGVSLFLALFAAEASAAWIGSPYYAPYTATVGVPYGPYSYYVPAPIYRPVVVTYVPRPVVYAPFVPVYGYPQIVSPWAYWGY